MATPTIFTNDVIMQANFGVSGTLTTPWGQGDMQQRDLQEFVIPLTWLRVWDAPTTNLPAAATSDDLGYPNATWASASPTVTSSDGKATTITQYARVRYALPYCYIAGQTVTLRAYAGMNTTVSDTTAQIDFEVFRASGTGGIGSDLCSTSITSINSLTNANKDFTIDPATLTPGDELDIRVKITITDSATATAVIGELGKLSLLLDIKP